MPNMIADKGKTGWKNHPRVLQTPDRTAELGYVPEDVTNRSLRLDNR